MHNEFCADHSRKSRGLKWYMRSDIPHHLKDDIKHANDSHIDFSLLIIERIPNHKEKRKYVLKWGCHDSATISPSHSQSTPSDPSHPLNRLGCTPALLAASPGVFDAKGDNAITYWNAVANIGYDQLFAVPDRVRWPHSLGLDVWMMPRFA